MSKLSTRGILSFVLALALAVTNVAFSGHLASHKVAGADHCSLCVHAAGADHAIIADASEIPIPCSTANYDSLGTGPVISSATFHDYPSRAPPAIT